MRFGIRTMMTALVMGGISLTAIAVHGAWYRTAENNSRALVGTLVTLVTDQVRKEFWNSVIHLEEQFGSLRERLAEKVGSAETLEKRVASIQSAMHGTSSINWVAHIGADGSFAAIRRIGAHFEGTTHIGGPSGGVATRQSWPAASHSSGLGTPNHFEISQEPWLRSARQFAMPAWSPVADTVFLDGAVAALSAPLDPAAPEKGVIATFRRSSDLADILNAIPVGKTGGVFMIGPEGNVVIDPIKMRADATTPSPDQIRLQEAARAAGERIRGRSESAKNIVEQVRLSAAGEMYSVALNPLEFRNWQLAVIIPEAEFLSEIDATTQRLFLALVAIVLASGLTAARLARRLIADPVLQVVSDLKNIETFELARIERRPTRLKEFDTLNAALQRVRIGLSAFGKFIPTDLVRSLLAEGVDAEPGGSQREISILFADIAGFTGLSERMGEEVVPLVSRYFDLMSRTITGNAGIIDKFIGDAVMAFWGAPVTNAAHAAAACKAALASLDALDSAGLRDDRGQPLTIRIGINSGTALVGNFGSPDRLNYTAIGDSVNVASRIESANKYYGTRILIGENTRRLVGNAIIAREIDRIAVYGRKEGMAIYEPMPAAKGLCMWLSDYEAGLRFYRSRSFLQAIDAFERVIQAKPLDGPSSVMIRTCKGLLVNPPAEGWMAITVMETK